MFRSQLTRARPAEILLVEDNENDAFLAQEGFRQHRFAVNLTHVDNGEKCLAFLRKQGEYVDAPTPDIVLLDMNMPVMGGREVLAEMVKDDQLNMVPVVVLTTSDLERDVLDMYRLRCSSYITKPIEFEEFKRVLTSVCDYWFTMVVLPTTVSTR